MEATEEIRRARGRTYYYRRLQKDRFAEFQAMLIRNKEYAKAWRIAKKSNCIVHRRNYSAYIQAYHSAKRALKYTIDFK
jgi:predicted transcriptional regulator